MGRLREGEREILREDGLRLIEPVLPLMRICVCIRAAAVYRRALARVLRGSIMQ